MSAFFLQDTLDPMTIIDFAVVLNQRLEDKLLGKPIDSRISGLSLCNLDRRADLTSIFVINEILAVEEGAELLFKLALMRCGPNNPAGYRKLIEVIESSYEDFRILSVFPLNLKEPKWDTPGSSLSSDSSSRHYVDSKLSLDLLVENLEGYDGPWGRSYRRTLMTANTVDRAKLILIYKKQADLCWNDLSRSFDGFEVNSTMTYQSVLKMLGGGAKFAAYQICLDIGYKFKELYDEDEHVLIGPGCLVPEEEIEAVKQKLQARVKMNVTKQTVEGLGCEYRKYLAGKPHYNQSSGNLEKYRAQYEELQRHLKEWNQSEVEKEEVSFAFSSTEEEEEPEPKLDELEIVIGVDFGGERKRWKNLQAVRTSWGRKLLVSDYDNEYFMNWRLSTSNGASLPMFQGKQGVMYMGYVNGNGSEDEDEVELWERWGHDVTYLVHYDNQQFLNMQDIMSDLKHCSLMEEKCDSKKGQWVKK
eukprot:SAG11_NODE_836_length_6927_cov_100.078940_2_plen_473_part_00